MNNEKWEDVCPLIEEADKHLYDALAAFYDKAPKSSQSKLRVKLAEYVYGDVLLSEGVPLLPNGEAFSEDFIVSPALPLGIVTSGCLEVVDGSDGQTSTKSYPPTSLAHLHKGDLVGIFEALDVSPNGGAQSMPDWTAYSGINTIHPLEDLATGGRHGKRSKHFGAGDIAHNEFKRAPMFGQQVLLYRKHLPNVFEWKTKIVFLSKGWFEELFQKDHSESVELFALRARDAMWQKAWHSVTATRNIHSASYKYFSAAGSGKKADRQAANLAYRMFVSLVDVAIGRKPFYVFDHLSSDVGPLPKLQSDFLSLDGLTGGMMRPAFASPSNMVGYLPFHYLLPELTNTRAASANAPEKIYESFSKIDEAGDKLPALDQNGESVPFLRNFPKLIERISLKRPIEGGAVKYISYSHNNGLKQHRLTEKEFFDHIPEEFNPKASSFFKHCMKLDLRDFQWE